MIAEGTLLDLARRHGIEPGFHDIWGTWHPLTRDTALGVLSAMGVDVSDEAAVERALAEDDWRDWRSLLPPVSVAREGDGFALLVCLPGALCDATLRWTLHCDDGSERGGESRVADMRLEGERDPGGGLVQRRELVLDAALPLGYHRLALRVGDLVASATLILAPRACQDVPQGESGARLWGVALQLYGLRSARNWGIGDFRDLTAAIDVLADLGADMVGLNPLHALFPSSPQRASPYSPSSRCFLNPAYLHVEAMQDYAECEAVREEVSGAGFQETLAALRASELVDYEHAVPLKLGVLRRLYGHFRDRHVTTGSPRAGSLEAFREAHGESLRRHAVFEVLHARFGGGDRPWPDGFEDPDGEVVARFARDHADDVAFAEYLQWQSAQQLEAAARQATVRGMRIGLYLDLAVGGAGQGADTWASPWLYAKGVSVGAPPDDFSLQGQVWGLPPWSPKALREHAYAPFAALLRANMHAAGALRIDHVLGLLRLFWVPDGQGAAQGAYVYYPLHDLLAVMALESRRARCVVVGEDLGTVPDGIRDALGDQGVLTYRVLYFEKHWEGDHSFRQPELYPEQALVTLSTHDLATLAGFWTGHDLDVRAALALFPDEAAEAGQREARHHDRWRLLDALERQGLRPLDPGVPGAEPSGELVRAVHRFLARSRAAIVSVQMEDVLGEVEQVNVPGTVSERPNWRHKLALPLEAWAAHEPLRALADAVTRERAEDRTAPL